MSEPSLETHPFAGDDAKGELYRLMCSQDARQAELDYKTMRKDPWWFWTGAVITQDGEDRLHPVKRAPSHEYLKRVLYSWLTETRVLVWKSRRLMLTWLICAFAVWQARFYEGRQIIIQVGDKSEDAADDLIKRCFFIDTHLPEHLVRHGRNPRNRGEHLKQRLEFPTVGSEIVALGAGPTEAAADQWRQFGPSLAVLDEFQLQNHGRAIMQAVNPVVPKKSFMEGGGGLIIVGTSRVGTYFQELVEGRGA